MTSPSPTRNLYPAARRTHIFAGAVASVFSMIAAATANSAELTVKIGGVRSDQGKVMVALHAPEAEVKFPDGAGTVAAQWRIAKSGTMQFVFADLPSGRFAVAVFHDENGNDTLDTNLLGIPKEGYAFSENARGFAGPPSFDAAAVDIASGETKTTTAKLGY